ncbi:hypothetical protein PRIPAC_86588 [Pristionchus pacificus]|uniref:Uncharacterized protein n=1 Tax=Pristionchus pacificus TaxID=54126 RepID=A0A454XTZ6_PRIPA|nr:hypothetical protein PRIPAC_86588 [Pristionchus pacificus]|eukprot:PDM68752.1 hypothetical protein PRIPAC_47054 [Pristionchus pacificus]
MSSQKKLRDEQFGMIYHLEGTQLGTAACFLAETDLDSSSLFERHSDVRMTLDKCYEYMMANSKYQVYAEPDGRIVGCFAPAGLDTCRSQLTGPSRLASGGAGLADLDGPVVCTCRNAYSDEIALKK